jgi:signal transduction histidine kinase
MSLYKSSGITVRVACDENLPLVPLDPEKIKQVILNLCKNAVEAMPEGGLLTVRAHQAEDHVILEFADTGHGIPSGFDPFQLFKTSKSEGTGLGLSIVQQIISDHHGTIDYITELGKGTTFMVSLPLSVNN